MSSTEEQHNTSGTTPGVGALWISTGSRNRARRQAKQKS